jgi:hypothetical protein
MLGVTSKPSMLSVIMPSVTMLSVIMLNVIMLNVIMLNVIMLNVIILRIVAPFEHFKVFVFKKNPCFASLANARQECNDWPNLAMIG